MSRRILHLAAFLTIAGALHLSAAVLLLPEQFQRGEAFDAPPAALAAGGAETRAMVADWERPPEAMTAPEAPPQPPAPTTAPPALILSDTAPAEVPQSPQLPMAQADEAFTPPSLPEVAELPEAPDASDAFLTLRASDRPAARPERRPAPAQPRAQPQSQPQAREPAAVAAPSRSVPQSVPGTAGQSGSTAAAPSGGDGGASAQSRAAAMARWGAQIQSCISRHAAAPRDLRQGGRVILSLTVSRDGRIGRVGVQQSSGQPRLDQAAAQAAQRAGRCPAAPAELTEASYPFQLPVTLTRR